MGERTMSTSVLRMRPAAVAREHDLAIETSKVVDADPHHHDGVGGIGASACKVPEMNSCLDAFVRTQIGIGHQSHCAFRICGYVGLVMSSALVIMLCVCLKLSVFTIVGIVGAALATFLSLAWLTKIVLREERLIYYHHQIAIIAVLAAMLWLIDEPILPYLDVATLGIGTFLAFGRVGCLMVGCCHGRPYRFGVCYTQEHAHAGFTPYYVGVRLFPIEVVECLWVAGIVSAGIAVSLSRQPAGATLSLYTVGYGFGRFFFEFMRGDASRPYWRGFSEAQWTSMILLLVVAGLELRGGLPYASWQVAATGFLAMIMAVIGVARRLQQTPVYRLLNPRHVREIAYALHAAHGREGTTTRANNPNPIFETCPVHNTSLGIRISASKHAEGPLWIQHYAISDRHGRMTDDIARTIAGAISAIERHLDSRELLKGRNGVYHLLLRRNAE
jgi:hypothetical protein